MFIFKVSLLLVSLTCISCNVNEDRLKLTLFFEGLCPGCHQFINDQLYPNVQKFADYINLDLVPLGHATHQKVNGKIEWTCQHGPAECYINEVNACFINLNTTQTKLVEFLHCFIAGFPKTPEAAEKVAVKCAKNQNVAWDKIKNCLDNEANELELAYENRQNSLAPPLVYVPNIRINDVYNQTVETSLAEDFFETMCQLLQQKPKACTKDISN